MRRYQRKYYMNSKVGGSKGSFKYFRHKKWLKLIEGKLGMGKLVSTDYRYWCL